MTDLTAALLLHLLAAFDACRIVAALPGAIRLTTALLLALRIALALHRIFARGLLERVARAAQRQKGDEQDERLHLIIPAEGGGRV